MIVLPSRCVAVTLLSLLLGCLDLVSRAQAPSTAGDTVYPVHGSVLDGMTGKPIAHALVSSPDRRLATMTDGDGNFALTVRVPARPQSGSSATVSAGPLPLFNAPLLLQAQKPGYLDLEQPLGLPLDETLPAQTIAIKLMPGGSIVGRVTAEHIDAPRGVTVILLRREVQEGLPVWNVNSQRSTDSLGEFHFTHLRPGAYTVVSAEWRGREPQPTWTSTTVTREYSPVFLGDVSSFAAATRVHLHPGETVPAELHLHLASYYPVTVPVAITAAGNAFIQVHLAEAAQSGTYETLALGYNAHDSAVEGWLPEGNFTLRLSSYGDHPLFALASVHVAGRPVRENPVTLTPAGTIQVRVHSELQHPAGAPIPNLQINLRGLDAGGAWVNGHLDPGTTSEFSIENVQPGRYMAVAFPGEGYVAGMVCGSVDLLHAPLTTTANGTVDPIDIILRNDGGTLAGKVITDGPSFTPVFVVLIPTGDAGVVRHTFVMANRDFTMAGIPPGTYRLIAVTTQPQSLPYRDPEALRAYARRGTLVTVSPGQQVTADAPLLSPAEVDAESETP